jgi:ABC-type transport system involved in multi-copper enzyme maturation permease subunit
VTIVARVALSVFRESVRDRVLYSLVLFAVLLIGASYAIGQLTAGQDIKIIKDLGLAAISVFGLLMAVFIGIGLVWKEVERRSIYNLLSKPLRRHEFILGKYFGLVLTLVVNLGAMTVAFFVVLAVMGRTFPAEARASWAAPAADAALLVAIGLILVELALVTAVALFFSTFSTPYLSAVLTLSLWVIGTFNQDLRNFEAVVASPQAAWLMRGLYYVLPNFGAFDVKAQVVHGLAVPAAYVLTTVAYGVVYVSLLLVAAVLVFSRRDFK